MGEADAEMLRRRCLVAVAFRWTAVLVLVLIASSCTATREPKNSTSSFMVCTSLLTAMDTAACMRWSCATVRAT